MAVNLFWCYMLFYSKLSMSCAWIDVEKSAQFVFVHIGRPTIALFFFKALVIAVEFLNRCFAIPAILLFEPNRLLTL